MAEKISKTARASMGQRGGAGATRSCPECGSELVATKVVRSAGQPGGMFWICHKDDYRVRTR